MTAGPKWVVISRPTGPHRTTFMLCDAWAGEQVATFDDAAQAEAVARVLNGAATVYEAELAHVKNNEPF